MKRVLRTFSTIALCALLTGCAYMQDRGKDFVEIWRGGVGLGFGALAEVRVGDVLHLGAGGAAFGNEIGASYGSLMEEKNTEVIFGPFHATSWIWHGNGGPWNSTQCWQTPPCQHCLGVLPVLTNHSVRTWLHRFDLEVRVTALVSVEVGFSPGEFVDFIVGWFGLELDPPRQDPPKDWRSGIPGPFEPPPRKQEPESKEPAPAAK